jgi:pimeloyl-ACP methyl ester carboxylesterase
MGERGFVIESGRGSRVVVILPSMLVLTESYRPTVREMAQYFHVVALGMPGMGRGSKLREPWGFERYAQWINSALNTLGVGRATVIGHSNSGATAIHLAAQYSDRIAQVVLADPIGARRQWLPRVIAGRGVDGAIEVALSAAGWHHVAYNMIFHRRNFWNQVRLAAETDLVDVAPRVTAPTLIAWGMRDHTTPSNDAQRLHAMIPGAKVYLSRTGSHDWIVDHPRDFAMMCQAFIGSVA